MFSFTKRPGTFSGRLRRRGGWIALALFPFTAKIIGKLDCETLKFDAKIVNGTYIIGVLPFGFEGPLLTDYDRQTHTFINGTWNVTEPMYPTADGEGTWTVQWKHP
jgi:hypothetical protein